MMDFPGAADARCPGMPAACAPFDGTGKARILWKKLYYLEEFNL